MNPDANVGNLSDRLRILEDIEAIESLKAKYWRSLDRKRPTDVESCLAVNAIVDFEGLPCYHSREAFMGLVRQAAKNPHAYNMHHGHNPVIDITSANTATGNWDVFYFGIDIAQNMLTQMAGAYQDSYICENGVWLISSMTMAITSLHLQSTDPVPRSITFGRAAS